MLESGLYFLLGFLAAGLLALMVSPVIWQRAVTLTRERVEKSVPLTLNEIQADKDQLRAEFAMSTRRLEISIEELREKASHQVIEINRKRDDIAKLAEEQTHKLRTIEDLQAKSGDLRVNLRQREEQLESTNSKLADAREKLAENAKYLEETRSNLEQEKTNSDSARIELVARQTQIENMSDKLSLYEVGGKSGSKNGGSNTLLAKAEASLVTARKDAEEYKTRSEDATSKLDATNAQLEQVEHELSRLRNSAGDEDAQNAELTSQIMEQRSLNVELEAKLAQSALQMEALLKDASNENVKKAMTALEVDNRDTTAELKAARAERDALAKEVEAFSNSHAKNWDDDRRENAILRERINDLAAQVTAMTAALEGDTSPINEILARTENTKPARKSSKSATKPTTLADRIRALQNAARG